MTTIVITGLLAWPDNLLGALREHDVKFIRYMEETGYVARLSDDRPAFILVDGNHPSWRFWTVTPKVSPATRRIPVVLVTNDPEKRDVALRSGANLVVSPIDFVDELPMILTELARVPSAEETAELDRQCDEPLPTGAIEAVHKFNAGEYHEQHDEFEALWMREPGPVRQLYQGVLQVGIAYYQITRGNGRGALKMLLRTIQWLAPLPDVCQGINVAQLRADAAAVRAELERVGVENINQFDKSLLKPVQMMER